jgi:hypothetical protein
MDKIDEEMKLKIYQRAYYLKQKKIKSLNKGLFFKKGNFIITFN